MSDRQIVDGESFTRIDRGRRDIDVGRLVDGGDEPGDSDRSDDDERDSDEKPRVDEEPSMRSEAGSGAVHTHMVPRFAAPCESYPQGRRMHRAGFIIEE